MAPAHLLDLGLEGRRVLVAGAARGIGRVADPVEVALPTLFLLSRRASYVTGTTLHVNGGQLMA